MSLKMFLSKTFFFYSFLIAVIGLRASSVDAKPYSNRVSLHNEKTLLCPPQQVFNIYNTDHNEQKPEPEQEEEKPSIEVPDGFIVTPGVGAHKFHLDKKNWNNARNTCIKEGGYLAVISSKAEEELFEKWTAENKLGDNWIGVHDFFNVGEWVTVLGQPLDNVGYKHWKAGEPNNAGGVEHCVTNGIKGGMDDHECYREHTFICEAHLD